MASHGAHGAPSPKKAPSPLSHIGPKARTKVILRDCIVSRYLMGDQHGCDVFATSDATVADLKKSCAADTVYLVGGPGFVDDMSQKRVASDTMRLHAIDDRNIVTMQISLTSVRGKVAAVRSIITIFF